jgi:hypothetical protein
MGMYFQSTSYMGASASNRFSVYVAFSYIISLNRQHRDTGYNGPNNGYATWLA